MRTWRRNTLAVVMGVLILQLAGCSTIQENPRAAKGVGIGALAGAAAGAGLGALAGGGKGAAIGAGIGAGVGALSGGVIGHYLDKQARELEQIMAMDRATNDRITRLEDSLQLSLASDTMFDFNKATLQPGAQAKLVRFAQNINRYDRTNVLVIGHTDGVGSDEYNQRLSEQRAATVRNVLVDTGVNPARITMRGDGKRSPVATNDTPEGRAMNRRVEIVLAADEGLRREEQQAVGAPPAPGAGY